MATKRIVMTIFPKGIPLVDGFDHLPTVRGENKKSLKLPPIDDYQIPLPLFFGGVNFHVTPFNALQLHLSSNQLGSILHKDNGILRCVSKGVLICRCGVQNATEKTNVLFLMEESSKLSFIAPTISGNFLKSSYSFLQSRPAFNFGKKIHPKTSQNPQPSRGLRKSNLKILLVLRS